MERGLRRDEGICVGSRLGKSLLSGGEAEIWSFVGIKINADGDGVVDCTIGINGTGTKGAAEIGEVCVEREA